MAQPGYNVVNSPHLAPALELDTAILELSGRLSSLGVPTTINSASDLSALASAVEKVISDLKLYEYYVFNVSAHKQELQSALASSVTSQPWKGLSLQNRSVEELAQILKSEQGVVPGLGKFAKRGGVRVEPEVALGFVEAAFGEADDKLDRWARVLDVANVELYNEFNADKAAQTDNVVSRAKYERLESHGPRIGEISDKSVLFFFPLRVSSFFDPICSRLL